MKRSHLDSAGAVLTSLNPDWLPAPAAVPQAHGSVVKGSFLLCLFPNHAFATLWLPHSGTTTLPGGCFFLRAAIPAGTCSNMRQTP